MKRTMSIAVLVLLTGAAFVTAADFDPYDATIDTAGGELAAGIAAYRAVHGAIRSSDFEEAGVHVDAVDEHLGQAIAEGGDAARVAHLYLAHMYIELIVDAASWFAYQPRFEAHYAAFVAAGGEGADLLYLDAKKMLLFPPSMGGDLGRAREIFEELAAEDLYEAEFFLARTYLSEGDSVAALEVLEGRAPEELSEAALVLRRRLEIENAAPRIRTVEIATKPRVAQPLLDAAIVLAVGESLSAATAAETLSNLGELPGISSASIDYRYDEAQNEVDVLLTLSEGSQRIVGVVASSILFADIDRSNPITPLLLYMDENLFGRGVGLSVVTAGIYWQLGLTFPVGDTADIHVSGDSMVLPLDTLDFYLADGRPDDENSIARSNVSFSIGTGMAMGPVSASLDYQLKREFYEEGDDTVDGYRLPDDFLHRGSVSLVFDSSEDIYNGAGLTGYRLGAGLGYDYYSGYENWGTDDFRNEAPSNGFGTTTYQINAAWGHRIGRKADVGLRLGGFGGQNYYTRSLYRIGAPVLDAGSGLFLRGYPIDSIEAERALIAHANLGAEVIPGSLHLSVFSDAALIEAPERVWEDPELLSSAGVAVAAKLPWSLDLAVAWAHGFGALDGSTDSPSDMLSITLSRLAAF